MIPSIAASWLSKTTAGPRCLRIAGVTPAVFTTAPSGASDPKRTARPPRAEWGFVDGADHLVVRRGRLRHVVAERAGDRRPVEVEEAEAARGARGSPGRRRRAWTSSMCHGPLGATFVEVRRPVGDLVDPLDRVVEPRLAGDRERVEDGVRRAPHRHVEGEGVVDRLAGDDLPGGQVGGDQVDDPRRGGLRDRLALRASGRARSR